ncbi:MAG TPA: heme o synthase [Jatrophihabitans sp.]|jgi:protoheme IX farnesyltransferase
MVGTASVPGRAQRGARPFVAALSDYFALTKPRIIELLLVTTVPAMMLAAHGLPPIGLAAATLVGGSLAAGSANALNCYLDRDIDAVMHRTAGRPLNRSLISPRRALIFGLILGAVSVALLWLTTDALAAWLAAAAIAFYVLVYTALLKRRTSSNIVWGGAAGCMPVLIGWAAISDSVTWTPVVLFAVVFLWTPPHFWALAMQFRDDYAAAGVPMLPVVASPEFVAGRILMYSWAMVGTSLLLWPVAKTGPVYPLAAALCGGWFLAKAYELRGRIRAGLPAHSTRVFHASITYLACLFLAAAVSTVLPAAWH